jgi:integrase
MMKRLGHSSVQVTLDRYGHLFPEVKAHITDGLDLVYRRVQGRDLPRRSLEIA